MMCTTIAKEVVQHYKEHGTDIHVCLLDASKVFDKVFQTLLDQIYPLRLINLLMNNYLDQVIIVKSDLQYPVNVKLLLVFGKGK